MLFLGKNPWQSHGLPRAQPTLREIARDPARTMIVMDLRRSETAALADLHLQVRPGTDAWCLAGMLGVVVQTDLLGWLGFLAERATGAEPVLAVLAGVDVAACARECGVPAELLRTAARRFATAGSAVTFEDLGVQQSAQHAGVLPQQAAVDPDRQLGASGTMVTGARNIAGLVPCNAISEEILTDYPERFRAMWIDSSNPAHSLADSARYRRALDALELVVVVDVALTETARLADYVLPAASQ